MLTYQSSELRTLCVIRSHGSSLYHMTKLVLYSSKVTVINDIKLLLCSNLRTRHCSLGCEMLHDNTVLESQQLIFSAIYKTRVGSFISAEVFGSHYDQQI